MHKLYFVVVNDSKEEILKNSSPELLARALAISNQGVDKLLARMPGPVTKAIPKPQAKKVAENFAKAGVSTTVKAVSEKLSQAADTSIKQSPKSKSVAATAVKAKPKQVKTEENKAQKQASEIKTEIKTEVKAEIKAEMKPKAEAVKNTSEISKTKITAKQEPMPASSAQNDVKSSSISEIDSVDLYKPVLKTRLWRKIFSISSTTALLLFLANMAIFWFAIRPILQEQLIMARLEPSLVASASLSDNVAISNDNLKVSPKLLTQLVKTIDTKSIDFLVISDLKANTVTSWHPNFAIDNALEQEIIRQAQLAIKGNTGIYTQNSATNFIQKIINPNAISIAYQPLLKDSQIAGATIIGVDNRSINNLLNRIFLIWLVLSLIPLALSYLISAFRSHRIAKNMLNIGRTADEISRGNLSNEVTPQTNDELQHISNALERLRVSMSEALIRLRRRR